MAKRPEKYQGDLVRLMSEVASFKDFSHLERLEGRGVGLPEVRAAMAAWDAHLNPILAGASTAKASVTAINKRRRRA